MITNAERVIRSHLARESVMDWHAKNDPAYIVVRVQDHQLSDHWTTAERCESVADAMSLAAYLRIRGKRAYVSVY